MHLLQDRPAPDGRCRARMAHSRPRPAPYPGRPRPHRRGRRRRGRAAAERGAHVRTRRTAGAQLTARGLPDGLYRCHGHRPGRRTCRARPAGPRTGRSRRRSVASPTSSAARAPLRRLGGLAGPVGTGGSRHDVLHRVRPGLSGRRRGGAGAARLRAALAAGASAGCGAGGGVRQLAVPRAGRRDGGPPASRCGPTSIRYGAWHRRAVSPRATTGPRMYSTPR